MAKTSYKECWWLVRAVDGEIGSGSFLNGRGYSLRDLNDLRSPGSGIHYEWHDLNENAKREKDNFRHQIMDWRAIVYNEFNLAIIMGSTSGHASGEGGYYYYLANPELLDNLGKTLREHIEFLAKSEANRDDWVKPGEINVHYGNKTSRAMGFVSAGNSMSCGFLSESNTASRFILGEEKLVLVQFAMKFGEVLTIKFGKIRAGVDINAPYSFEPYQLKEIEGRWYVIGNLYPVGQKDLAEIAIYDLARLGFSDEENPDVLYEPVEGYDIYEHFAIDSACLRRFKGVRAIDLISHNDEFTNYLLKHPLCSAQEVIEDGTLRIYISLSPDIIIQLGAYGDELSIGLPSKEGDGNHDRYYIREALEHFRKAKDRR